MTAYRVHFDRDLGLHSTPRFTSEFAVELEAQDSRAAARIALAISKDRGVDDLQPRVELAAETAIWTHGTGLHRSAGAELSA